MRWASKSGSSVYTPPEWHPSSHRRRRPQPSRRMMRGFWKLETTLVSHGACVCTDATLILGPALEAYDKDRQSEGYPYLGYFVESGQTKVSAIRSDGVIGVIIHGAGGVRKYFSRIFLGV
ncbi:hypothetical protein F4604DRAFT_228562 [Suillus subluteus]|nr:hypothetical protein F4604DRAFT_228562 [Suillus subluteus]